MTGNPGDSPAVYAPVTHPSCWSEERLLAECSVRRGRDGGPGGQHRNKVETAVELRHLPTGISSYASERRSQEQNRRVAITRLRIELAVRLRCVRSPIVEPTPMWMERCRHGKISCNDEHVDFAAMLAEALDAIDAKEFDVRRAAAALGCSSTQLIRFVGRVPEALGIVNSNREARGLRKLRT